MFSNPRGSSLITNNLMEVCASYPNKMYQLKFNAKCKHRGIHPNDSKDKPV